MCWLKRLILVYLSGDYYVTPIIIHYTLPVSFRQRSFPHFYFINSLFHSSIPDVRILILCLVSRSRLILKDRDPGSLKAQDILYSGAHLLLLLSFPLSSRIVLAEVHSHVYIDIKIDWYAYLKSIHFNLNGF